MKLLLSLFPTYPTRQTQTLCVCVCVWYRQFVPPATLLDWVVCTVLISSVVCMCICVCVGGERGCLLFVRWTVVLVSDQCNPCPSGFCAFGAFCEARESSSRLNSNGSREEINGRLVSKQDSNVRLLVCLSVGLSVCLSVCRTVHLSV